MTHSYVPRRPLRRRAALALMLASALLLPKAAAADEIRVLSSVGIKTVLEELAPRFEKTSTHKVTVVFDLASALRTRIDKGEPFDVAILTPALIDELIAKKRVGAKTNIARTGLGLMIKAGGRKPQVTSVDAFKRTLLSATAITYPSAGASGTAFLAIVKQLGIAGSIKTRPAATADEVNANILSGAADLAVAPISEILPVRGAALGGVFPADIQTHIVMTAGTKAVSPSAAARDFITFLASPTNNAVLTKKGMERVK